MLGYPEQAEALIGGFVADVLYYYALSSACFVMIVAVIKLGRACRQLYLAYKAVVDRQTLLAVFACALGFVDVDVVNLRRVCADVAAAASSAVIL